MNDPESGLVYMQARYYDPSVGRFISMDPMGSSAGNTFNFNRFAYANNSPIDNMDPDGRCTGSLFCDTGPLSNAPGTVGEGKTFFVNSSESEGGGNKPSLQSKSTNTSGVGKSSAAGVAIGALGQTEGVGGKLLSAVSEAASQTLLVVEATLSLSGDTPKTQFVVRGGLCDVCRFSGGSGVTIDHDGNLQNVSVQSFPNTSIEQLSRRQWVPNNMIGVTTVQRVLGQGGHVIPAPTKNNPYHAVLSGVTPQQAQMLFTVTPNPNPQP